MAYNSRYTRGYAQDEVPINRHDASDEEEEDLGDVDLNDGMPMQARLNPFADTAYSGYRPGYDTELDEPTPYQQTVVHQSHYSEVPLVEDLKTPIPSITRTSSPYEPSLKERFAGSPGPGVQPEVDPEAGFRERQQPLRRGHTRKVKLVNGDIFCTDYP